MDRYEETRCLTTKPPGCSILKKVPDNWDVGWFESRGLGKFLDVSVSRLLLSKRWYVWILVIMIISLVVMGGLGYFVGWRARGLAMESEMLQRCIDD